MLFRSYVSSLTTHPMIAAIGAFGGLVLLMFAGDQLTTNLEQKNLGILAAFAQVLSPGKNFEPLGRGIIDSYAVVCSLLLAVLFLTLTVRQLEARRLRG